MWRKSSPALLRIASFLRRVADRELLGILLDSPEDMLKEHHASFCAKTGLEPHISTFCRAVRRLGFSRQQLHGFARARDEAAAGAFKRYILCRFTKEQLFFIDETSKDNRVLKR